MKLKQYLKERGIKQQFFADALGIARQNFSLYVNGIQPFPIKYWKKIVSLTNGEISVEDLMESFEVSKVD